MAHLPNRHRCELEKDIRDGFFRDAKDAAHAIHDNITGPDGGYMLNKKRRR